MPLLEHPQTVYRHSLPQVLLVLHSKRLPLSVDDPAKRQPSGPSQSRVYRHRQSTEKVN